MIMLDELLGFIKIYTFMEKIKNAIGKLFPVKKKKKDDYDFYLYKIAFKCQDKLSKYSLTEDEIVENIKAEFQGHINYFKWDIRDYPFPLKINYIVLLEKNEKEIVIKDIYKCTENQAQLVDWDAILGLYRQLSRYKYRENPDLVIRNRGLISEVARKHSDLKNLFTKYFKKYYGYSIGYQPTNNIEIENSLFLELSQSAECLRRVADIMNGYSKGFVSPEDAKGAVITEIEKSLQHLHKIIILYPPKQEDAESTQKTV